MYVLRVLFATVELITAVVVPTYARSTSGQLLSVFSILYQIIAVVL